MSSLSEWLAQNGLASVIDKLIENDIDLDLVADISDSDLTNLGFSLGQRKRFLRAVAALEGEVANPQSQARQTQTEIRPQSTTGHAQRRQLSVLFCDLVGSTRLSEKLDLEDLRHIIGRYQAVVSHTVEENSGYVARFLGDGLLAYFGYPAAKEDDAVRAVSVGLEIIAAVGILNQELSTPLQVRVGIATGVVVAGDIIGQGGAEEHSVLGETPNLAARLEGACEPNTLLVCASTWQLVQRQFEGELRGGLSLKGITSTNSAYCIARKIELGTVQNYDLPLVGRAQELNRVIMFWDDAKQGRPQLVLVVGEPGIGKSRLVREFLHSLDNEPTLTVHLICSPYRIHSAFFPLIEGFQAYFAKTQQSNFESGEHVHNQCSKLGLSDEDVTYLLDLMSIDPVAGLPQLPESAIARRAGTLECVVRFIKILSDVQALVLHVEDIHWIDPSTLEVLVSMLQELDTSPLLILASSRPQFDEKPFRKQTHATVSLGPLSREETLALIEQVTPIESALIEEVLDKTDGVPLFIEELAKVVGKSEEPLAFGEVGVPTSLQSLLMSRLDGLEDAKNMAQIGAVIGREFSGALLGEVAGLAAQQVDYHLNALLDAELIQHRDRTSDRYVFKHALVQDTAYGSLLKDDREQLHAKVASSLQNLHPETAETEPEILAHHFTQAGQVLKGAEFWQHAGRLAASQSANSESMAYLQRGLDLLGKEPASVERDHIELSIQVMRVGVFKGAKGIAAVETGDASSRALELCEALGESEPLIPILTGLYAFNLLRSNNHQALHFGERLLSVAQTGGDVTNIMIGHRAYGAVSFHTGNLIDARQHIEKSLRLYDKDLHGRNAFIYGADHREAATSFYSLTLWTLGRQTESLKTQRDIVEYCVELGHSHSYAQAMVFLAFLATLANDPDAKEISNTLVDYAQPRDFPMMLGAAQFFKGVAMFRSEDYVSGMQLMQEGSKTWWSTGATNYRPYAVMLLALGHLQLGDIKQAEQHLQDARQRLHDYHEFWSLPELLRVEGVFAQAEGDFAVAEKKFIEAKEDALKRSALSWCLRIDHSYAELLALLDRKDEARELLSQQYSNAIFASWEQQTNEHALEAL